MTYESRTVVRATCDASQIPQRLSIAEMCAEAAAHAERIRTKSDADRTYRNRRVAEGFAKRDENTRHYLTAALAQMRAGRRGQWWKSPELIEACSTVGPKIDAGQIGRLMRIAEKDGTVEVTQRRGRNLWRIKVAA